MIAPREKGKSGRAGLLPAVERFSKRQRVEHLIILLLFFFLVLTGFPQKYHDTLWAGWVVIVLGGLDLVHWFHRMAGLMFSVFLVYYVTTVSFSIIRGRKAASLVPFPADVNDILQSLLWYVGLRDRPQTPVFDYRQKFEFWGLFFGGLVMAVTGLMLYFPLWTTLWLPGIFIPAAKTAHSYEAMVALLVIVIWHLYHTVLRPSVFPLDKTMLTGRMSLERLKEEHPLEYARLFPGEGEGMEEGKGSPGGTPAPSSPA